jgi:hypothetical protein
LGCFFAFLTLGGAAGGGGSTTGSGTGAGGSGTTTGTGGGSTTGGSTTGAACFFPRPFGGIRLPGLLSPLFRFHKGKELREVEPTIV